MNKTRLGRITRDGVIFAFAITAATFEITVGGGRGSVLTFLLAILLSPFILRLEDRRAQRMEEPNAPPPAAPAESSTTP